MNWWQWCLLLAGIGAASWLIPAMIIGYVFGEVFGSIGEMLKK
jgi:hypothetical protein